MNDMLTFFVYTTYLSVFLLAMFIAWNSFNDAFQASDLPDDTQTFFQEQTTAYNARADFIFITVFGALIIGVLILSYFLQTYPIMFWAMWLFVMVLSAVSGYWANAYETITADGEMAVANASMPMMHYVLTHYLHFMVVLTLLMLLVFFAKPQGGSYG